MEGLFVGVKLCARRARCCESMGQAPPDYGSITWGGHSTMIINGRLRWKLLGGLLAAVLFDTLLQIAWKSAVLETPSDPSPIAVVISLLSNPALLGIIAIMALQFFNWLMVLGQADLSYAKPVSSLSYACVPIVSV